jgi:hypothetical protein
MTSATAGLIAADGDDCRSEGDVADNGLIGPDLSGTPIKVWTHAADGEADSFGRGRTSRRGKHGESAHTAEANGVEIDDKIGSSGL